MPSSADLLDANVWLALTAEAHIHHDRAEKYWYSEAAPLASFCRVTQLALLRHLTNKSVMEKHVLTPAAAWEKCAEILALPEVRLMAEPVVFVSSDLGFSARLSNVLLDILLDS